MMMMLKTINLIFFFLETDVNNLTDPKR